MRTKHIDIKELKLAAIKMRDGGCTYPEIETSLGVSRSTLSGWLRHLNLSKVALERIKNRKDAHLQQARLLANEAHRQSKIREVESVQMEVRRAFRNYPFNRLMFEGWLAMLYLGEGFRNRSALGFGNSNPRILALFVKLLRKVYKINEQKFRCCLYLRCDQIVETETRFWSKVLSIPKERFSKPQFDKRTLGKKTWDGYHGVCAIMYYDARLEKRVVAVAEYLMERILTGN